MSLRDSRCKHHHPSRFCLISIKIETQEQLAWLKVGSMPTRLSATPRFAVWPGSPDPTWRHCREPGPPRIGLAAADDQGEGRQLASWSKKDADLLIWMENSIGAVVAVMEDVCGLAVAPRTDYSSTSDVS